MSTASDSAEKSWMLATLKELAEIGMEMARDVQTEVRQAGGSVSADATMRFSRVSRAVRQTVGLYGVVLEDGLVDKLKAPGARSPRGPTQKDIKAGAEVRDNAATYAGYQIRNALPPEMLDAFADEVAEWRADASFDHIYAKSEYIVVAAEIFMMLGIGVPEGWLYWDQYKQLLDEHAAGKAQPWREAWEFLRDRERPHHREGWTLRDWVRLRISQEEDEAKAKAQASENADAQAEGP